MERGSTGASWSKAMRPFASTRSFCTIERLTTRRTPIPVNKMTILRIGFPFRRQVLRDYPTDHQQPGTRGCQAHRLHQQGGPQLIEELPQEKRKTEQSQAQQK